MTGHPPELLVVDPFDARLFCECCGFPTRFVPADETPEPDLSASTLACPLCEWENAPLTADGEPVDDVPSEEERNDGIGLDEARANFERHLEIHDPARLPPWKVAPASGELRRLKAELCEAYEALLDAPERERWPPWEDVLRLEEAVASQSRTDAGAIGEGEEWADAPDLDAAAIARASPAEPPRSAREMRMDRSLARERPAKRPRVYRPPDDSGRPLSRRSWICARTGLLGGAAYSVIAMVLDAFPGRREERWGWEPSLLDTLSPVAGGLLMGLLVAVLWPMRARKTTAIVAGLVSGLPFACAVIVSLSGRETLGLADLLAAASTTFVLGLPLGAFMHDYDR